MKSKATLRLLASNFTTARRNRGSRNYVSWSLIKLHYFNASGLSESRDNKLEFGATKLLEVCYVCNNEATINVAP